MKLVTCCWLLVGGISLFLLVTGFLRPEASYAQTKEENTVYKTNLGNSPRESIKQEEEIPKGILEQLRLGGIISSLTSLFRSISEPKKLYAQSDSLSQSNFPAEVRPEAKSTDIISNIKGYLGGVGAGFYGIASPVAPSDPNKIVNYEELREKSFYPEGISPITGQ